MDYLTSAIGRHSVRGVRGNKEDTFDMDTGQATERT
jgi:hypothetical protein